MLQGRLECLIYPMKTIVSFQDLSGHKVELVQEERTLSHRLRYWTAGGEKEIRDSILHLFRIFRHLRAWQE